MINKIYNSYIPCCDNCGDTLTGQCSFQDALDAVKEANWSREYCENNGGYWINYCIDCQ